MSNPTTPSFPDFGKLVPGFDFLQNLSRQAAGSAAPGPSQLPNLGNWIAPTLNVEELDKRIQELKSVQFWLDQNAAALKATLQALEVQKMTLATLKGMNFSMSEMASAFTLKAADSAARGSQPDSDKAPPPPSPSPAAAAAASATAPDPAKAEKSTDASGSFADPMKWWGALTQQFQVIAAQALKETAKKAAPGTGHNAAPQAVKAAVPARTARQPAAKTAVKTAAKTAAQPAVKSAPNAAAKSGAQSVAKTTARATARPAVKPAAAPGAAAPGAAASARKAAARKTTR